MHPDLPYEQAYFDRALALRDRQQADLARSPRLAANPRAAVELRKRVSGLGLADPDEAIAFGRIEAGDSRWYIGKGAIWDDDNDLVVVNWQAPIAAPFYTATPDHPEGLDARRLYRCTGNQIREIEDLLFHEVATAISEGRPPEPVLSDALLDSLGGARSGELGDIVATIQASQYEVISRPLDELLVVQGGPGTGKTVVGLHRVSWLLFNRRDRLDPRDVLVVGPNPAFVRYIASVLPSLGDEAVVQLPVQALGPGVRIGKVDPPEVRRLKGDRRMLRLVLRGLRNRQRVEAVPVELTVEGRQVGLDGRRIATRARQLAGRPHNEGHRMLRAFLVSEVRAALSARPGAPDPSAHGDAWRDVDNYLGRVWPRLTPQAFLVELLSSRRQLLAAGAGTLSEAELELLAMPTGAQVTTWQWSVDDVAVLDAAAALLDGVPATYDHIVVDEAQDLSPLQLESIRRRSRAGSMTVLGDLAQATSPWAPATWDPIVHALRHERVTAELAQLEYGYRLPAEVHEVAMRLLPEIAPEMASPLPLRSSGHDIEVVTAADAGGLGPRVAATAGALAADGLVGVIVPAELRPEVVSALDEAGMAWAGELRASAEPVVVLTPGEAKGLEFDSVVVVEPAAIVDAPDHGVHALFVALTRCTNRLALVHARALPPALRSPAVDVAEALEGVDPDATAEDLAAAQHPEPGRAGGAGAGAGLDLPDHPTPVAAAAATDHGTADRAPDTAAAASAGGDEQGLRDQPAPGTASTVDDLAPSEADETGEAGDQVAAAATDSYDADDATATFDSYDATAVDDSYDADVATAAFESYDATAVDDSYDADGTTAVGDQAAGATADPYDATSAAEAGAPGPAGLAPPPVASLADRVVVSTPAIDAAVESLGDLDHDIAAAVARAVVERVSRVLGASLLPLVADQIARAFAEHAASAGIRGTEGAERAASAGIRGTERAASAGIRGTEGAGEPTGAGGAGPPDEPDPPGAGVPRRGGRPGPVTGWDDTRALHRGR